MFCIKELVPEVKHLLWLGIILTMEDVSMGVSCCAALSFSTMLMTSEKVLGSFFINLSCGGVCIQRSFNKYVEGYSVIVKGALLS